MDVFGYGTDEPTRPLLPPGLCWICENSPQQEAMKVIDTRRNSRPEARGQSERKYVCEPCAKELGAAVGQVSAEDHRAVVGVATDLQQTVSDLKYDLESARSQQTAVVSVSDLQSELSSLLVGEFAKLKPPAAVRKVPIAAPPASTDA